jgi:hypothetical protein
VAVATALVALLALALAALTYFGLERLGRRAVVPMVLRAVAWGSLFLLLLNASCPVTEPPRRPLVLLDASLSMGAPGARWDEARREAQRLGDVRQVGAEAGAPVTSDSIPSGGRTLLGPALRAVAGAERPVVVVTDGEIEDRADLPADLLGRTGVRLFPRAARPDAAITEVRGPSRLTAGDTLVVEADVRVVADAARDSVAVVLELGSRVLARRSVAVRGGAARARLTAEGAALPAGTHLLRVRIADTSDAEPRTDRRWHLVSVAETPGVVLIADPPDWDSRFLYETLRDVADLPVRGYARIEANRWRSMTDLSVVPEDRVLQALRGADLVVLKGGAARLAEGAGVRARGRWLWPSGEGGEQLLPGDWYLDASGASPVAGAFLGAPVDSFPPATQLVPIQPPAGAWVALTAQESRRGAARPAVIGETEGGARRVTVAADGLWRWAFAGGASREAYRAWVAATTSWLLAAPDTAQGKARPVRAVVQNGRPVVFEWLGPGEPAPLPVVWTASGASATRSDTLRFDGAGRAEARLPVGVWRYGLGSRAGEGIVAVEAYSDELLPRPVVLAEQPARPAVPARRSPARDWPWLFGLCVAGLAGEWFARRRLGLR